jgi:Tfp pilus assembly protein PilE
VTHGVSGKKAHDARLVAAMIVSAVTHILTFIAIEDWQRQATKSRLTLALPAPTLKSVWKYI